MHGLTVQIVRFVDSHQPGWVECELVDAEDRRHLIIDKAPVFSAEDIEADSEYPVTATMRCEVLKRYQDEAGHHLVRVSTARPDGIESTEGLSEFTIPANLITPIPE